jgi:hypothetical protein
LWNPKFVPCGFQRLPQRLPLFPSLFNSLGAAGGVGFSFPLFVRAILGAWFATGHEFMPLLKRPRLSPRIGPLALVSHGLPSIKFKQRHFKQAPPL